MSMVERFRLWRFRAHRVRTRTRARRVTFGLLPLAWLALFLWLFLTVAWWAAYLALPVSWVVDALVVKRLEVDDFLTDSEVPGVRTS
jgi:hypothetical protein